MELRVLGPSLEPIHIIDEFESLIWTERYFESGDFELYTPYNSDIFRILSKDTYVWLDDARSLMIVEDREITTDIETGIHMKIVGRSLTTILNRRIVWNRAVLSGDFQKGIRDLLNDNAITPTDPARVIPGLIFQATTDPEITPLAVDAQYVGDNLYDVILSLCSEQNVGFKITPTEAGELIFSLYMGVNRSYNQTVNSYVTFSPEFDNFLHSEYKESTTNFRNVALVGGEGVDAAQIFSVVGTSEGLNRREVYVDAKDITSAPAVETDPVMTPEEYIAQLQHRGEEELSKYFESTSITGEADTTANFKYGVDYIKGDILQLENEFGMTFSAQVTEMIFSQDPSKKTAVPTFKVIY